jgi:hypothetical protein
MHVIQHWRRLTAAVLIGVLLLSGLFTARPALAQPAQLGFWARFFYPAPDGEDRDQIPVGDDVAVVLYFYKPVTGGPASMSIGWRYPDGMEYSTATADWSSSLSTGLCEVVSVTEPASGTIVLNIAGIGDWMGPDGSNACLINTVVSFSTPGVKSIVSTDDPSTSDIAIEDSSYFFEAFNNSDAVITVVGDDPEVVEEPEITAPPAECAQAPDMAITPEAVELPVGGRTTMTVTLRNLCADAPYSYSDLLLSLSDGLSVVGGSNGLVNLGRRAAFQGFALAPGETRSFTFDVSAAASLPTAPLHVVELYRLGAVVKRIDGVFVGASVTAPAPTVVPAQPAAPAAPAPLPAALPNTAAGDTLLLSLFALAALGLLLVGRRLQRR